MSFKCKICGNRIFSTQYGRCFGGCKRIICNSCLVENKCIDCYVEVNQDYLIQEYIFDNPILIKDD